MTSANQQADKLAAVDAAAKAWGVSQQGLMAVDISSKLPSLSRFRPFMVMDPARRRMVVAIESGGTKLHFGEAPQVQAAERLRARIEALNALLAGEPFAIPGGVPPAELAELCRMSLEAPGGLVGTQQLLAQVDPPDPPASAGQPPAPPKPKPIDQWISPSPADGRALFVEHCADPRVEHEGDDWTLSFSFFRPDGGVERWTVTGRAREVLSARRVDALPARTFFWPYA